MDEMISLKKREHADIVNNLKRFEYLAMFTLAGVTVLTKVTEAEETRYKI